MLLVTESCCCVWCASIAHGGQIHDIRFGWCQTACRGEQGLGYSVHQLARLNRQLNDDADFAHLAQEMPLALSQDRLCSVSQIRCMHSCIQLQAGSGMVFCGHDVISIYFTVSTCPLAATHLSLLVLARTPVWCEWP